MSNSTLKAKNPRSSKFLGNRRSTKRNHQQSLNFNFVRENQGSISTTFMEGGVIRCTFVSQKTNRKAFAYGRTFKKSYQNMIRNFNEKYDA